MERGLPTAENSWLISESICKTSLLQLLLGVGLHILCLQPRLYFL